MSKSRSDGASSARAPKTGRPAVPEAIAASDDGRPYNVAPRWYVQTSVAMLKDKTLSPEAKILAGILLHYNGPRGCYPSTETLAEDVNVSRHTLYRLLEELEIYGFLVRERIGRNNRYHLHPTYEKPVRSDSLEATGELQTENAPRQVPIRRKDLRKPRSSPASEPTPVLPAPTDLAAARERSGLPLHGERVAPVRPIGGTDLVGSARCVAPVRPVPPSSNDGNVESVAPVRHIGSEPESGNVASVRHEGVAPVRHLAPEMSQPCDLDIIKNQSLSKTSNQEGPSSAGAALSEPAAAEGEKDRRETVAALRAVGVDAETAELLATEYGAERCGSAVAKLRDRRRRGRETTNPAGFVVSAIRRGWPSTSEVEVIHPQPIPMPAPGAIADLRHRLQEGRVPDAAWLRDVGISGAHFRAIQDEVDRARQADDLARFPFCDELERRDPIAYDESMQAIYEGLRPPFGATPGGYKHVIFFSRCRGILERQLSCSKSGVDDEEPPI